MTKPRHNKLLQAVETYLNVNQETTGIVRVKHGAQFSNGAAIFGWFLTLFLILVVIFLLIENSHFSALVALMSCVPITAYILDFQGFEIDSENGKIRNYKSFLGIRSGEWLPLCDFNRLKIYQDSILEGRELASGASFSSSNAYDTHNFFTLYLISDDAKHLIKLYENQSVTRVRIFAAKFASLSQLEFIERISKRKPEVIR